MAELIVPAYITKVQTIDPGEIRVIELTLPAEWEIDNVRVPVEDTMRPGNAFLTKPWGARTEKWRRRMYTRSNASIDSPHVLETIINFTDTEKSDTSLWWQGDEVLAWQKRGQALDIRVQWNAEQTALQIYENSRQCYPTNLHLEPDGEWEQMRFLAVALSTGITPFLSYLRYMKHGRFGRTANHPGTDIKLIVSVAHERQLMAHEELLLLEREFPQNFSYHPVLTRSWPTDWSFTTGRIIRGDESAKEGEGIDLSPLLTACPDLEQRHVRFCGNKMARNQLQEGLQRSGMHPLSLRAEVW